MLVGWVSNERYEALADVMLEFRREGSVYPTRSTISGAVHAELDAGNYEVVIGKDGYGSKIVNVEVSEEHPHHFRLLSDTLFGYIWPKYVKAGERAEIRVHVVEEYELELWRYGVEKEFIRRLGTFD